MIDEEVKKNTLPRLKRIAGQIRGIMRMIDSDQYCIDIINQITAAEKALDGVAKIVMKRHVETCVANAIVDGKGQQKIDELLQTVFKDTALSADIPASTVAGDCCHGKTPCH